MTKRRINFHPTANNRSGPIGKALGDLKVRPKLALLHNLFFLLLSVSVYFSVIPVFEDKIASARQRELVIVAQLFQAELPLGNKSSKEEQDLDLYNYREGLPRRCRRYDKCAGECRSGDCNQVSM